MKLKKLAFSVLLILAMAFAGGCGTPEASLETDMRTITDLGGNQVSLPPAEEIQRVVIIAPPTVSMLLGIIPDSDMIVGASSQAFTLSNTDILSQLFSGWKNVETSFVTEGFVSNTEEILNLNPDIIFYYGESQKSGVENLDIPIVDLMIKGNYNAETVTIEWDKLLRKIFEADDSTSLQSEWKITNKKSAEIFKTYKGEKKSALFLFSNTGGVITVYGSNSYADTWFGKSGLENVASELSGMAEVSMEQIYEWNPDYIYVFIGNPASVMLNNQIDGQDWSLLTAYKNHTILDIPQSIFSWGSPCSDAPLTPLWMISKSYPEFLSENDFKNIFADYYSRMYHIKMEEELIDSVLSPRKMQK